MSCHAYGALQVHDRDGPLVIEHWHEMIPTRPSPTVPFRLVQDARPTSAMARTFERWLPGKCTLTSTETTDCIQPRLANITPDGAAEQTQSMPQPSRILKK